MKNFINEEDKNNEVEIVRKKYLYRKLILSKKINIPIEKAVKIIGQDCAFHLYKKSKTSNQEGNP